MHPSPFSRPPQPTTAPMYVRSPTPVVEPSRVGPTGEARQALERRRRIGGQWFYWIAGLSLVNAAIGFTGADWRFILGLGVTQIVQELANSGSNGTTGRSGRPGRDRDLHGPRAARRPGARLGLRARHDTLCARRRHLRAGRAPVSM